jgi:teichuronic acid biosynthesis glycosyltransferase TuaC
MKILSLTTLFPTRVQPVHAIFVYNRLNHMAELAEVKVVAPVPYFPFENLRPSYQYRSQVPSKDRFGNLEVSYPRYLSIPAVLKPLDGIFLFLSAWLAVRKIQREFDFDILDTHLSFPDGFAGVLLGKIFNKPVTITLRGHDINVLPSPEFPIRKRMVEFGIRRANLVIGVADALRLQAVALGTPDENSVAIPNGVDASRFSVQCRTDARKKLNLPTDRPIVLSVGRLNKGYHLIVEALAVLKQQGKKIPYLVIVGSPGDEPAYTATLEAEIDKFKMREHVFHAGAQLNETLNDWYNAADVYCLASRTEGWPNVLLESLACGTPVVASNIDGTPEIITSENYGILVERSPAAFAEGISQALSRVWNRTEISEYAASRTWEKTARAVIQAFQKLI